MRNVLVALVLGAATIASAILALRAADLRRRRLSRRCYELWFPRSLRIDAVEAFVRSLAGLRLPRWQRLAATPTVVWEIYGTPESIGFRLIVESATAEFVLGQLRAACPGLRAEETGGEPPEPTLAAELRLSSWERPLMVEHPEAFAAGFLAALRPLSAGDTLVLQIVITPAAPPSTQSKSGLDAVGLVTGRRDPNPRSAGREPAKGTGPRFLCAVRLGASSSTDDRARQLLRRLLAPFHLTTGPGVSFRHTRSASWGVRLRLAGRAVPLLMWRCLLNVRELATVLATPLGDIALAGLTLGRARQLPLAPQWPSTGPAFAVSDALGSEGRLLTFSVTASAPFHAWLVGPTGSGKSTVLENLIQGFMRAGAALLLIDPKKDLADRVIDFVPRSRVGDCVVMDLADPDTVVAIDAFAGGDPYRTADRIASIVTRLWPPGAVGPRSADLVRGAVFALAAAPGATLIDVARFWSDAGFRRWVLSHVRDEVVLGQWAAFDALSSAEQASWVAAPANKWRALIGHRAARAALGASNGLDLERVFRDGGLVFASTSKGLVGPDASALIGALLLDLAWGVLSQRIGLASTQRRPVVIIVDEAQDIIPRLPDGASGILSQGRALGVGMIVSHQGVFQMPSETRTQLRTNARSKLVFGLSPSEARLMAEDFAPFLTAEDLMGLGRFELAAKVCVDGEVLPAATGRSLAPPASAGTAAAVRESSRQRFGRPRGEVEQEIRERGAKPQGLGAIGRGRRR